MHGIILRAVPSRAILLASKHYLFDRPLWKNFLFDGRMTLE